MKNTYKLLLAFCFIGILQAKAQQISVGPEAGFTFAGMYNTEGDASGGVYINEGLMAGINGHLGATLHVQFGRFFAIRPSLLYKFGTMTNTDYDDVKFTMHRISIPAPLLFSYVFRNDGNLFAGAGPNLMYNFAGRVKNSLGESDLTFGSGERSFKPIDLGIQFKAGYRFPVGVFMNAFLNFGITDIDNINGTATRTLDAFGFSVGYLFGGRSNDY